jgi:hypothetical protein
MIYRKRELRRLWELKVYKTDKKVHTRTETVIAWNAVDAIRQARGEVATQPKAVCYVTWDDPPLEIYDPTAGPIDKIVTPSIPLPEQW